MTKQCMNDYGGWSPLHGTDCGCIALRPEATKWLNPIPTPSPCKCRYRKVKGKWQQVESCREHLPEEALK